MKTRPKTRCRGFSARKTKFLRVFCKNRGSKRNYWVDLGSNSQNLPVWTAGTKTKKVRGLKAKNWTWLEFLLNWTERGLISKELKDSFAKVTGAYRYFSV